jgi:hypothetical protein
MALAFAAIARVGDGLMAFARFAIPIAIVDKTFLNPEWFEISPFLS